MPPTPTRLRARPTTATKPIPPKKKGGGAVVVVAGVAAGGGLIWWLLSRRRRGGGTGLPPPANPVVSVGNDQAVTLDATSHAAITINFTVVADNPVNLAWSRTSGPASVQFSILGPTQERVTFTAPGTYLIRLTATDTTDGRAQGFDEMVVTVNAAGMVAILVTGELKVDGFASYTLTKAQGQAISFVWPVMNVGSLDGAAFIQLTEGGAVVGTGAAFPIPPGGTVDLNFNPVVSLASGIHILVATVLEGLPPTGIPIGSPQVITLTVVSVPALSAVGDPTINGLVGATAISVSRFSTSPIPILWPCQNIGGGSGLARLKAVEPRGTSLSATGGLVTIPGFSTVSLLLSLSKGFVAAFTAYNVTLTMEDSTGVVLGTWLFSVIFE